MTSAARRLKKLRSKAGLNQSQLARSVNVTRAAASRWEQGDIDSILARNAIRVADTLDTSVEYLFTGKQPCTQIDVDALSRAIRIVEQVLKNLTPKGKATIVALVYQLILNDQPVSKNVVRQLKEAA
ncbi:MAG TPA: XRE family transcriptional regulator [Gammaproteobacteria bacterium]|jgi:transcriptional regulator with XRE-family HTH domain|nr:XRE family transcriptional regulator [Gammaproteobacteria bacterium]